MFSAFDINSFLGFNAQSSGIVQELLNRTDLKLEDLLDEEAVASEVKAQNSKLLDFLLDPENFKRIINYIISEQEVDEFDFDQKKCFKFPYVCADLLSCECDPIVNEFFKSRAELEEAERAEEQRDKEIEKEYEEAEKAKENAAGTNTKGGLENSDEVVIEKEESPTLKAGSPLYSNSKTVESNELTEEEVLTAKKDGEDLVYLSHLFTILDKKDVNLTCAGYFVKVVNNLFSKRPSEILTYVYKNNKDVLDKLVSQIGSKSIAELLAKLLTFETSALSDPHEEVYNTERNRTLQLILQKLHSSCDTEEINNSAYLICEVFGKYNIMHSSHEILEKILERPVIDSLFNILNLRDNVPSCAAALVLGNLFAYYILINTKVQKAPDDEVINEENLDQHQNLQHTELSSDIPLIAAFLEHIKSIVEYIGTPVNTEQVHTQFGNIIPFGAAKLKFLELLIISLKAGNKDIYIKLIEHDFFGTLLKLIVHYEWNNMLHNQIEKILSFVLEGNNEELKEDLLGKADIINFVINAYNEEEFTLKGKYERKLRRGYLGHIVKISNKLLESKDSLIQKYLQNNPRWSEYVKTKLTEINAKDNLILGGKDPRAIDESLCGPMIGLEFPDLIQKFSKILNGEYDKDNKICENKEEDILEEEIPKDEIKLMEEEKAHSEGSNKETHPKEHKEHAHNKPVSINKKLIEDVEDESNILWFSDPPTPTSSTEENTHNTKKEEKTDPQTTTDAKSESVPKGDFIEGEGYPSSIIKTEESHTAEDLLKEVEGN